MPYYFYDLVIALVVAAVPLYLGERRLRGKPVGALGVMLIVLWLVVIYGSFIEPRLLRVDRQSVALSEDGPTLRIAVLSDMHFGYYRHEEWAVELVRRTNELHPDVVLLAGDMASTLSGTAAFKPFRAFKSPIGTFAALGNWDYGAGAVDVRKAVESAGVEVLTNEALPLDVQGRRIWLVGLDDLQYGRPDWDAALAGVPDGAQTILLAHNPDFASAAELHGMSLMIAGHTHCGQVRLPLLGPVPELPTSLGRHFDCGVFQYGRMPMFITPGVGESGPRARLFDPPAISLLEVRL